jgi:TusA-related sulfurtransferase
MSKIVEVDLRGVNMPGHLQQATKAVEDAASGSEVVLTTDQEVVIKYVPSAAAKVGVKMRMSMPTEDVWQIKLSLGKKPVKG